jgi:hypothetical protein
MKTKREMDPQKTPFLIKQRDINKKNSDKEGDEEKGIAIFYKNTKKKEYTQFLTTDEIDFLQNFFTNNRDTLQHIFDSINDIVCNRTIDLHHIPEIILFLSNIYKECLEKEREKEIDILSILRFTLDSIFDSGWFHLPMIETFLLKKITDNSLALLQTNLPMMEKKDDEVCCFSWCKKRTKN